VGAEVLSWSSWTEKMLPVGNNPSIKKNSLQSCFSWNCLKFFTSRTKGHLDLVPFRGSYHVWYMAGEGVLFSFNNNEPVCFYWFKVVLFLCSFRMIGLRMQL
jgi:hypothetical protein